MPEYRIIKKFLPETVEIFFFEIHKYPAGEIALYLERGLRRPCRHTLFYALHEYPSGDQRKAVPGLSLGK